MAALGAWGWVAACAAAVAVPLLAPNPATVNTGVFTLMYVGLASAWNILGGYSGYISLGYAASFGTGAYALALLLGALHVPAGFLPLAYVPLAGLVAAVLAAPLGWVALRTRAATFVIVTIAEMFAVQLLAFNLRALTQGSQGLGLPVPPWGPQFYPVPYYYAMLALAAGTVGLSAGVRRSRFGLGLLAIRDDEDRARSLGIPTRAFTLAAYVLSVLPVGMIGAVYAYYVTYIYPQFVVDPLIDIGMALMVFLGGMGTLAGPVLGAVVLVPAQQYLAYRYGASQLYLILYSAVFLGVILLMPQGIVPEIAGRLRRRAGPGTAVAAAPGR
jgi:branched-chain amino acid transport system permease protein